MSTSMATAQNARANSVRVTTLGRSNCPANSASMIVESPRLNRRLRSEATA
jgi:hypothetical protein